MEVVLGSVSAAVHDGVAESIRVVACPIAVSFIHSEQRLVNLACPVQQYLFAVPFARLLLMGAVLL